jgi:hypothetical protein
VLDDADHEAAARGDDLLHLDSEGLPGLEPALEPQQCAVVAVEGPAVGELRIRVHLDVRREPCEYLADVAAIEGLEGAPGELDVLLHVRGSGHALFVSAAGIGYTCRSGRDPFVVG